MEGLSRQDRASGAVSLRASERVEREAILQAKQTAVETLQAIYWSVMVLVQVSDAVSDLVSEGTYFHAIYDNSTSSAADGDEEDLGTVFNLLYGAHALVAVAVSFNTIRALVEAIKVVRERRRRSANAGRLSASTGADKERSKKDALLARAATQPSGLDTEDWGSDSDAAQGQASERPPPPPPPPPALHAIYAALR